MLTEIQKEWVAALRSGTIQQTAGVLGKTNGSRCCLGVACDLAVKHGVIDPPVANSGGFIIFGRSIGSLPPTVRDWLSLRSRNGDGASIVNSLAELNDSGMNFEDIADIIESEPDGLFVR